MAAAIGDAGQAVAATTTGGTVFTGNVVVTKGTIIIRGARIDVRQDPDGYQYGVVTAAPGKLAYYKQKRDAGTDEWIEGESEVIEYPLSALGYEAILGRDVLASCVLIYDGTAGTFTLTY